MENMDCHRCLAEDGDLAELTYPNGGTHQMYLCEECFTNFETDDSVGSIAHSQAA